jgi:hypothetical protein
MERLLTLGAVFLLGIILVSGCTQNPGKGLLQGNVSIGPLCPVERNPPDPACQPTAQTYESWPIFVWTPGKLAMVAELQPTPPNGTYSLELPAGNYVVDLEKSQALGARNLPANITIRPGQATALDISIDTGIR